MIPQNIKQSLKEMRDIKGSILYGKTSTRAQRKEIAIALETVIDKLECNLSEMLNGITLKMTNEEMN